VHPLAQSFLLKLEPPVSENFVDLHVACSTPAIFSRGDLSFLETNQGKRDFCLVMRSLFDHLTHLLGDVGSILPLTTLIAHVGRDFFDYDKALSGATILQHLLRR